MTPIATILAAVLPRRGFFAAIGKAIVGRTNLAPQFSGRFAVTYPALNQPCPLATLTEEQFDVARNISQYWNNALTPDQSRITEPWAVRTPNQPACCHDFAVTKLADLVGRGIPRGAVALALCSLPDTEYHLVLLARTADGVWDFDSRFDEPCLVTDCLQYKWISQEAFGTPGKWIAMS